MIIQRTGLNSLYRSCLEHVLMHGRTSSPRGKRTYETTGAVLVLHDPSQNLVTCKRRKVIYTFAVAEWLWMLLGRNDVQSISYFNPHIHYFSDDGIAFQGAYGPKLIDQLPWCINKLHEDNDTRQAVLTIWRERPSVSKDVPCTCLMQFFLRGKGPDRSEKVNNKRLEMVTYMRSNDIWLGMPYDIFNFTMIQGYVAAALGVRPGKYTHMVGSLHLYDEHVDAARELLNEPRQINLLATPQPTFPLPADVPEWFSVFSSDRWMNISSQKSEAWEVLLCMRAKVPVPWSGYLEVLAYRTHKRLNWLTPFWQEVYHHGR